MLLNNKKAVIFGAGGAVAGAVAREFALEGAEVFLSGRNLASVETVANDIDQAGGKAHIAQVDATDETEVIGYLDKVIQVAGHIDIVFNGVTPQPIEFDYGGYTADIAFEDFMLPVNVLISSQFIVSRAAARHMIKRGSGVIAVLTATIAQGPAPTIAGISTAHAALEGLILALAQEWTPMGIRVIGVRTEAMPETRTIQQGFEALARNAGLSQSEFTRAVADQSLIRRFPTTKEMAGLVAFAASDKAGLITGTTINASGGFQLG